MFVLHSDYNDQIKRLQNGNSQIIFDWPAPYICFVIRVTLVKVSFLLTTPAAIGKKRVFIGALRGLGGTRGRSPLISSAGSGGRSHAGRAWHALLPSDKYKMSAMSFLQVKSVISDMCNVISTSQKSHERYL